MPLILVHVIGWYIYGIMKVAWISCVDWILIIWYKGVYVTRAPAHATNVIMKSESGGREFPLAWTIIHFNSAISCGSDGEPGRFACRLYLCDQYHFSLLANESQINTC